MTHYLRTKGGKTVVEAETKGKHDLSVVVCIRVYSEMLLACDEVNRPDFIDEFDKVQELRGAYFEGGFNKKMTANDFLRVELKKIANYYGFDYVID